MSLIVDGTTGVTFNDSSLQGAAASPYVLKNRIINGDMRIDQRNAGASVTPSSGNTYLVDRWLLTTNQSSKLTIQQNYGSVTPPTGYTNYLGCVSTSAYSSGAGDQFSLQQRIEGLNIADLGWGTANAKTITLSFLVYSSLTGTFGGAIINNSANRSYPFTYTISSANTWTQISVTIAGDTSGTWLTTNGIGAYICWDLGSGTTYQGTANAWGSAFYFAPTGRTSVVGTNGATFYITGVQLEIGTSATPFERRLYGQELINCQRYYEKSYDISVVAGTITTTGCMSSSRQNGQIGNQIQFRVSKRATPTMVVYSTNNGASGFIYNENTNSNLANTTSRIGENSFITGATSSLTGEAQSFHYTASAEL